jgi:hypothetical protein
MTPDEYLKTLGFKDMHPEQVEALMLLIHSFLSLADGYENEDIFEQAKEIAEDAVILFGGHGIEVQYEALY